MRFLVALLVLLFVLAVKGREVDVSILANYRHPILSPIYSTALFLQREDTSLAWSFFEKLHEKYVDDIDRLLETDYSEEGENSASSMALDIASLLLPEEMLHILRLSLESQAYLAGIEAHHADGEVPAQKCETSASLFFQVANEKGNFETFCTLEELNAYIQQPKEYCLGSELHAVSITYPKQSFLATECHQSLIVTGVPGSSAFQDALTAIHGNEHAQNMVLSMRLAVEGVPSRPFSGLGPCQ